MDDTDALLAEQLDLPAAVQDRLSQHPDSAVRVVLASNPRLRPQVQHRLAHDRCPDVVVELAGNQRLDPTVQECLAGLGAAAVLHALARNPALAATHMVGLAQAHGASSEDARIGLASNRNLQWEAFAMLARDPSIPVRRALAGNVRLPPDIASGLARDVAEVRAQLAGNPSLPAHEVPGLVRGADPSWQLPREARMFLASRRDLPPDAKQALLSDSDPFVRRQLAGNLTLGGLHQIELARDPDASVRVALASNPSLGAGLQVALLGSADEWVDRAVARRRDLGRDALRTLLRRAETATAVHALREDLSSAFPSEQWRTCDLTHGHRGPRAAALADRAAVVAAAVASPDPLVRLAAVVNARVTDMQLRLLLADEDPIVRRQASLRLLADVAAA